MAKKERRIGNRQYDKTHVFVATPAYDGKVDTDYAQSLAETCFCAPLHNVFVTASVMGNGAFIDLARNIFVKMFLEKFTDATHLFFVDSDLKFEARAFLGLLKSGLPICAGMYRRRQEPPDYPVRMTENPDPPHGVWVEDGWIMCDRVPTGFLCIRRDIIEEMAADAPQLKIHGQEGPVPQLFYTKVTEDNRFMGEDFAFCDDYVARYKEPIRVWPDFEFTHGGYKCNWHDHLNEEADKLRNQETSAA